MSTTVRPTPRLEDGYAASVSLDPEAEYRRIREKYGAARPRDVLALALVGAAVFVASRFWDVDWSIFAGLVLGFIGWELTKFRLRRNAQDFVECSR